jgi:hypothetical protein
LQSPCFRALRTKLSEPQVPVLCKIHQLSAVSISAAVGLGWCQVSLSCAQVTSTIATLPQQDERVHRTISIDGASSIASPLIGTDTVQKNEGKADNMPARGLRASRLAPVLALITLCYCTSSYGATTAPQRAADSKKVREDSGPEQSATAERACLLRTINYDHRSSTSAVPSDRCNLRGLSSPSCRCQLRTLAMRLRSAADQGNAQRS